MKKSLDAQLKELCDVVHQKCEKCEKDTRTSCDDCVIEDDLSVFIDKVENNTITMSELLCRLIDNRIGTPVMNSLNHVGAAVNDLEERLITLEDKFR